MTSLFSKLLRSFRRPSSNSIGVKSAISGAAPLGLGSHPLQRPQPWGCWETCQIDDSGLLRVLGWSRGEAVVPDLWVNGVSIPLLNQYRTYRPDVARQTKMPFSGIAFEYQLPYNVILTEI